ncbi:forkhead box protein N1 [Chanos chanos]|uniref:Forkhead box protein N1 n=1 Tax=Chanos chanos TaxID=29144 RepID=A0A6J2VPP3_CHACN|nr:forkhead box protein N1 [Chanos chanos]
MATEHFSPVSVSSSSSGSGSSCPMTTQEELCAFNPIVSTCQQMAHSQFEKTSVGEGSDPFSQRKSISYRQKSAVVEKLRRHSTDGCYARPEPGPDEEGRFHPYCRQYSAGTGSGPHILDCFQTVELPHMFSATPTDADDVEKQSSWASYSPTTQASMFMGAAQMYSGIQTGSADPPSYPSQNNSTYSNLSSLQQFVALCRLYIRPYILSLSLSPKFSDVCPAGRLGSSSHYSYHGLSTNAAQESSTQPLYPKPIYSYSILIFMALRNSKTGSLPVSEIYSFMTEHFPYFKTAPDGWKNSVRHNLSLNKCFEKVENKNGSSSRKGCLWALNPTKVEKMQEELHKWRRKDPLTVRKSMAKPEELDRLLGEKPERFKSLSSHLSLSNAHSQLPRTDVVPSYSQSQSLGLSHSLQQPLYNHVPSLTVDPQPHCMPPNPQSFSFYSPASQQPSTGLPSRTGCLDSPLPANTPPTYSFAMQASHNGARSMQDLLLDGDVSSDIDTLNPSLTDLQLHGNLWEELRDDSLAPESLPVIDAPPSSLQSSPITRGRGSAGGDACTAGKEEGEQSGGSARHVAELYSSPYNSANDTAGALPVSGYIEVPLL